MPAASAAPKPVPAFYAVYILRSTQIRTAFYVGSTPNPARRLRQHNGEAAGGARRTSREDRRPWEMLGLVSGFPATMAALRFEWALDNPHMTTYIAPEDRISRGTGRRRRAKPVKSLTSLVKNLGLLLASASFARWPLRLHLFSPDFHREWRARIDGLPDLPVLVDFPPPGADPTAPPPSSKRPAAKPKKTKKATAASSQPPPERPESPACPPPWGIHALAVDYGPLREYVERANGVLAAAGPEVRCVFCAEVMPTAGGLHVMCPGAGCEAAGHLTCWSRHLLRREQQQQQRNEQQQQLIPVAGVCRSCGREVQWVDMMKELTLRMRGRKEVERLMKRRVGAKTGVRKKRKNGVEGSGSED